MCVAKTGFSMAGLPFPEAEREAGLSFGKGIQAGDADAAVFGSDCAAGEFPGLPPNTGQITLDCRIFQDYLTT